MSRAAGEAIKYWDDALKAAKKVAEDLGIGTKSSARTIKDNAKIDIRNSSNTRIQSQLTTLQESTNSFTPVNRGGSSKKVSVPLKDGDIKDRLRTKPQNVRDAVKPQQKTPILPIVPPLIPLIPPKPRTEPVDDKKIPFPPTPPAPNPSSEDNEIDPRRRRPGEGRRPPNEHTEPCDETPTPSPTPGPLPPGGSPDDYEPINANCGYLFYKIYISFYVDRARPSFHFWAGNFGPNANPNDPPNGDFSVVPPYSISPYEYTLSNHPEISSMESFVSIQAVFQDSAGQIISWWLSWGPIPGMPPQCLPRLKENGNEESSEENNRSIPCPPPGVDPPFPPDKLEECPDMSGCDCQTVYQIIQTVVAKYTAETQNHVTSSTEIGMEFVNESHDFTRNVITTAKEEILDSLRICCGDLSIKIDNIKPPEIKQFDEEAFKKWIITILGDFGRRTLSYIEKLFKEQTYFLEDRMINYHTQTTSRLEEIQSQIGILIEFQQEITNYFESVLDDLATIRQLIIECCQKMEDIDFSEILELIDTTATRLSQELSTTVTNTSGIVVATLANQILVSGNNTVIELGNAIANIQNILSNNFEKRTQINRQNLKIVYDLLLEIYKCCKESRTNLDCCEDIKGVLSFSLCDTEDTVDPASEIAEDVASQVTGSLVNLVSSLIPGNIDDAVLGALEGTIQKIVKGFVAVKIKPYVNTTQNARQIPYSGYAFKGIESQINALSQQLDLAVKEICSKSVECPDEEQYIFSGSLEFATCDENAPEISIWDTLVITTSNFVVSRIVSELVSKLFPFLKADFDDKTLDAIIGNLEDTIKNELKSLFYRFLPIPQNERLKPYHGYNFEGIEKMLLALSDQINYVAEQLCEKVAASVPVTPSAPVITKIILPTESQIDGLTNFQCEDYEGPLAFPYQGSGIQGLSSQLVAIENGMNVILKQVCSVKKEVSSDINGAYSFKCGNDITNFTYSGKGIIGLSSQLAALAQGVNAVLSKVCDSDSDINKNINDTRNQIIEVSNNNSQTTNQNIDNTRSQIINNDNENEQEINQNIQNISNSISNIENTVNNINNNINNPPTNPNNENPNNDEYVNGQIRLICNGTPMSYPYSGVGLEGISNGIEAMGNALQMVLDQVCKPDDFIVGELSIECDNYPYSFYYSGSGFDAIISSVSALNQVMQVVLNQVCGKIGTNIEFIDDSIELTCDNETTTYNYYGIGTVGITQGINALAKAIQLVLNRVCVLPTLEDCQQSTIEQISQITQEINQSFSEQIENTIDEQTSNITETISEITSNITETISNVAETISEITNISQAISENLNYNSTIQTILQNQLGNIVLTLNNYLEDYSENTTNTNSVLNQINSIITNILNSVSVEIANTHSIDCDVEIGKQVKPKPLYVTNGAGLYVVDPVENLVKEVVRSYLNPQNIAFSGFLPNSLLAGIPTSNIVANTLLSGFPGYSAIYSAIGLAANQLLELITPATSAIQFDGLTFNNEEKIYLARSTPDRQTQYFKIMPDTGDIELIAESPNDITEGVGAMTKTFVGQTDKEDPKVEYTYSLGVSNTREDFKLLRLNEFDFSSLEIVLPQEINVLLKSDPYTSGLPGSRQDYVLSITFDRDNNLYISSAQYDEDALGGYIKKRRLTRITNSGVGNISIIKDYPAIRATEATQINEIDEGVIFDVLSFDALNQLWGLDVSSTNSPILYKIENCTGEILSATSPVGETGTEHILLKGNYYNFQFAPNNPEKKLHCLCDGDFKPELEITYQQSQPQEYSYNGIGLKAIAQQVDQVFPILQQVVDKLCHPVKDEEYEKECLIVQCGNGYLDESVHEIIRYEGAGLKLLSSKLDAIIKQNQFLLNTTCQPSEEQGCVALLPDERYAEFTVTKQLVLTFGENYPKQTGSLWHVNIPMPIDNLDWCEHFENISMRKGSVNGRLYWENSKIYTGSYFESEEEARRVLALLAALSTSTPRQNNGSLDPRITKGAKTKRIPQNRVTRCVRAVVSDIDATGNPANVQCYKPPRGGC